MGTHSSIVAWKIPWTKEPGGLQSRGHKEVDLTEATEHSTAHRYEEMEGLGPGSQFLKTSNYLKTCPTRFSGAECLSPH